MGFAARSVRLWPGLKQLTVATFQQWHSAQMMECVLGHTEVQVADKAAATHLDPHLALQCRCALLNGSDGLAGLLYTAALGVQALLQL